MDEIRLPELAGKVIASAKLVQSHAYEHLLALEFEDGTSLSFSCSPRISSEFLHYRGGVGEPEVLLRKKIE